MTKRDSKSKPKKDERPTREETKLKDLAVKGEGVTGGRKAGGKEPDYTPVTFEPIKTS